MKVLLNGGCGTGVIMRAAFVFATVCVGAALAGPLVVEDFESAGIDGRYWDRAFPGARTADAVHRSLLLRFPSAAELLARGGAIARAEVVFEYEGYEVVPQDYTARHSYRAEWEKKPPRWHYVAWPLRRPWSGADAALAPTFNAWLNGAGYWSKYGARSESEDRYPACLGPVEVSLEHPTGRLDVTALLTNAVYGATPAERLRAFSEQGVLLRKWETYDMRYMDWGAYEWAVATGGHGLTFKNARLEVTFADDSAAPATLPPARDLAALAAQLKADHSGGAPTAVMPDDETIRGYAGAFSFSRPDWMPEWQWTRVQELRRLGGGCEFAAAITSGDPVLYRKQVAEILRTLPRYWLGWGVQDELLLWYQFHEALPECVQDHMKEYWRAWLYPDTPNNQLVADPQGDSKFAWYALTGDWRGCFSFFRVRWTQGVGTMNFNHTASMGALLGGSIIGSDYAVADGRAGLENMLLRFWSFLDGTSQEMLDHYYFSITLSGQKMFADYAPTHLDRLMGEMIRDRAVELLASAYHPRLRRMVSASGRTRISNVLGFEQEGGYSVLHTLSPKGVLFHADKPLMEKEHDIFLFGYDFPPGRVALQTRASPWAPGWAKHMVDDKPLPYQVTAAETTRNNFRNPPLWRRSYLGHYYGLASQDIKGGSVDVLGQWSSVDGVVDDADQLGTLTIRYNVNKPHMARTGGGMMPYVGATVVFQDKNRAIVCTKPRTEKDRTIKTAGENGVHSLFTTAALWNFREPAGWTLAVDGKKQERFPLTLKSGQKITLKDGNVFVAIIPLPATDLGRQTEIVIEPGQPESLGDRHEKVMVKPALMINSYNLQSETALPEDSPLWENICREAYGGFVVEMSDSTEFGSFSAFQKHIRKTRLETRWEESERILHITYNSGSDLMEMGFCTDYPQSEVHYAVEPGQHTKAIRYRRINGSDPYLPAGIDRDTTLTQQGTSGRLEKNGAVLVMEPGRTGYLQTELQSGTFIGYNPLPDLSDWSLSVPGGMVVRADGKLGLARVAVSPAANSVVVDQAYKPEQVAVAGRARRLLVSGVTRAPAVTLNGRALTQLEQGAAGSGMAAYIIPLE